MVAATGDLLNATVQAGFKIATNPVPLAEVAQAWAQNGDMRRTVLTLDPPRS